jgi:hypothetical protein
MNPGTIIVGIVGGSFVCAVLIIQIIFWLVAREEKCANHVMSKIRNIKQQNN